MFVLPFNTIVLVFVLPVNKTVRIFVLPVEKSVLMSVVPVDKTVLASLSCLLAKLYSRLSCLLTKLYSPLVLLDDRQACAVTWKMRARVIPVMPPPAVRLRPLTGTLFARAGKAGVERTAQLTSMNAKKVSNLSYSCLSLNVRKVRNLS